MSRSAAPAATDSNTVKHNPAPENGSVMVTALVVIVSLTLVTAAYYEGLVPKYRSVYQGASWQEALHGAEAGAEYALQALNQFPATQKNANTYDWTGTGWTTPASENAVRTPPGSLPVLGGTNGVQVTSLTMDVYTRDTTTENNPWFRIRSTARADLPGRYVSSDRRDAELRRMKLRGSASYTRPSVSRTVEVVVKPRFRFSRAITTVDSMSLGSSSNWMVDSFDSTDTNKSEPGTTAGGIYPSANPSEIQSNGSVATAAVLPLGVTYGPLINGNGAVVRGDVQTAGGDNPSTSTYENVSGSGGMDQTRIRDDFDEEIPPATMPTWTSWSSNPPGLTNFTTSANSNAPARYITGNLGAFTVTAPASGTGYIEIRVAGNVSIGNGNSAKIVIPPSVNCTLYVQGNIDFGNGTVNSDAASSKVASRLNVYGVGTTGTYTASGNAVQILSFYGPAYAVNFNGTVTTIGSVVGKSFGINGGGNGGFHYDEALGKGGDIAGWIPASYFEDTRVDL